MRSLLSLLTALLTSTAVAVPTTISGSGAHIRRAKCHSVGKHGPTNTTGNGTYYSPMPSTTPKNITTHYTKDNATRSEAEASAKSPPNASTNYNKVIPLPSWADETGHLRVDGSSHYGEANRSRGDAMKHPGQGVRFCKNDAPTDHLDAPAAQLDKAMSHFKGLPDRNATKEVNIHPGKCIVKYPRTERQSSENGRGGVRVSICSPEKEGKEFPRLSVQNVAVWAAIKDIKDHCERHQGGMLGGGSTLWSSRPETNFMYVMVDGMPEFGD